MAGNDRAGSSPGQRNRRSVPRPSARRQGLRPGGRPQSPRHAPPPPATPRAIASRKARAPGGSSGHVRLTAQFLAGLAAAVAKRNSWVPKSSLARDRHAGRRAGSRSAIAICLPGRDKRDDPENTWIGPETCRRRCSLTRSTQIENAGHPGRACLSNWRSWSGACRKRTERRQPEARNLKSPAAARRKVR